MSSVSGANSANRVAYSVGGLLEAVYGLFRLKVEPAMTRFLASQLAGQRLLTSVFLVKALGGGRFEARGPLTIKGKTVEVVTPFTYRDAPGGGMIDGNFSVKRLQFNIGEGAWKDTDTVADEVQIRYQLLLSRPQTPAKK